MLSGKNERVKQRVVKVVLDTNILVSSLLTAGPPAVIVDFIADGKNNPLKIKKSMRMTGYFMTLLLRQQLT